jgi:hypothetical protein
MSTADGLLLMTKVAYATRAPTNAFLLDQEAMHEQPMKACCGSWMPCTGLREWAAEEMQRGKARLDSPTMRLSYGRHAGSIFAHEIDNLIAHQACHYVLFYL